MFGIDDAVAAGLKVLDKFIPDPAEKAKAETALRESLQQWDQMQADVNKAEAQSPNLFVSGWRPFIGWVCGAALAYSYVLAPLIMYVANLSGHPIPKPPPLDGFLGALVIALLGLGGLRTYEKVKNVAAK